MELPAFLLRRFPRLANRFQSREPGTGDRPTSTQKRLFLISLIAINLVASFLILSIYTSVKIRLQSEARSSYATIMHQASRELETFIHNGLFYLGTLSMDEQLQDLLRTSAAEQLQDRLRLLHVQQALKRLKIHDQDIQSVYFFKFLPGLVICDRGIYPQPAAFADYQLFSQLAVEKATSFSRYRIIPRKMAPLSTAKESIDVLTLVLPINIPDLRGALVMNLRVSWFQNLFTRTLSSLAGSTYLYLPDGWLVTSTASPPKGLTVPPIAPNAAESGLRYERLNGTRSLVFYSRGHYGLTLIHVVDNGLIYRSAYVVRDTLLGLWVAIFLVSLPIALRIKKLANRPIERLYSFLRNNQYIPADSSVRSEVELLMQAYQRLADTNLIYRRQLSGYRPLFDEMLLMNILSGKGDPIPPSSNYRRTYLSTFLHRLYCCCILEVDDFPHYSRIHPIDKRGEDSAFILRAIEKHFPGAKVVSHILEDRIVIVCPADQMNESSFDDALARTHQKISAHLQYSVTIAVGKYGSTIGELPDSYHAAEVALEQKFIKGKGRILSHRDIPGEQRSDQSINEMLKQMQISVKNSNARRAAECLDKILSLVSPRHHVKEAFAVVSAKILSSLASILEKKELEVPDSEDLSEVLERCETLSSLKNWFQVVLKNVFQQVELYKRQKNIDYLERVQSLIDQQYMNPLLQISDIAEHFNLSPTYFGRFFNEITGKSFTTYVNDVRLHHAAGLLESSDFTVNEVAENVGFNSTQYFIRVFKRKYRSTPGSYKSQYSKKHSEARRSDETSVAW